MSTSSVTMSGLSAWTSPTASFPSRATPATSNSPDSSRICEISRRMKALSSTTSTRRSEDTRPLSHRPHLDSAVGEMEVDAATVVAAHVFADDLDAARRERLAHGGDVALADVDP